MCVVSVINEIKHGNAKELGVCACASVSVGWFGGGGPTLKKDQGRKGGPGQLAVHTERWQVNILTKHKQSRTCARVRHSRQTG